MYKGCSQMSQSGRTVKKSIVGILDRTLCFETINQQKFYTVCQNTGSTRINQNTLKTISIAIAVTGPVSPKNPQFEYYTYRIKEVFGSIGENVIISQKLSDMAFYLLDPPPSLVWQIAHQSLATIRNLS